MCSNFVTDLLAKCRAVHPSSLRALTSIDVLSIRYVMTSRCPSLRKEKQFIRLDSLYVLSELIICTCTYVHQSTESALNQQQVYMQLVYGTYMYICAIHIHTTLATCACIILYMNMYSALLTYMQIHHVYVRICTHAHVCQPNFINL